MIDAMKQALAALETCDIDYDYDENPYNTFDAEDVSEAITALRQAIEQAEKQEPVANRSDCGHKEFMPLCQRCQAIGTQAHNYTAPPKREWVGLTGLEVSHYNSRLSGSGVAEEIEAKLRERNT